ncbi:MAG TPA: serine/threonine-protein kinase [Kofleriaceae bacterium]|nr:serine/threonine-protein kinase [Kofleriaceae bacterium]
MMQPEPLEAMIGRRFGDGVVVRLIGVGGMGAVYEAENRSLGSRHAIKVMLPEPAKSPGAVERFFQEARAAGAIDHPRILSVIDHGYTDDGRPFLLMPLLAGRDLDRYCDEVGAERGHRGRIEVPTALPLFFQILDGLAAAHDRKIVHRDIKGANIHVLDDHTIKILDFGIAKLFDPGQRDVERTCTLQIVGTPGYMAPEQARGGPIDDRTDIWAVGAVFFRALTGCLPFEGRDPIEMAAKAIVTRPPAVTEFRPEVPARLSEVLRSCLAANPNERPDSARMVAHALIGAVPAGREIAEQVAPTLLERSGPGDLTIRWPAERIPSPASPLPAPSTSHPAATRAASTRHTQSAFGARPCRLRRAPRGAAFVVVAVEPFDIDGPPVAGSVDPACLPPRARALASLPVGRAWGGVRYLLPSPGSAGRLALAFPGVDRCRHWRALAGPPRPYSRRRRAK